MTFQVTYRSKDGRTIAENLEAESRRDVFDILSKRGISAIKVEAVDSRQRSHKRSLNVRRAIGARSIVWTVVGLIVAGIGLYLARGMNPDNDSESKISKVKRPPRIEKTTPALPVAVQNADTNLVVASEEPEKPEPPPYVKRAGQMQLPNGKILTFPPPKGDEIRKVYAYGHMYECDSEGNFRDVTKRQLFHTAFEANFLGLANEDKPFIPAFLTGLDEDEVKKILKKNYEPIGDETEEEMAELKAYDDMRCAALQYMEEGGSFDEFVDYFAKQVKNERQTNALCLREVMTLYKEGKIAEARDMAEAAEALKSQQGLKPFKIPPHVQEAFDALP